MGDGLKVISDKEAIKAKIEDCIKKARIEKAFDILEENAECFNASKEDIHLARANYVKAEKDNELGLSDREEVSRVRSRTIRFIQHTIKERRRLETIGNKKFWVIVISIFLIISLFYIGKEYVFTEDKNQIENTDLSKENLKRYFRKLKDSTVEIAEKNKLIDKILYSYGGKDFNVEIRGKNDNLMDKKKLSYVLRQLKFGDYDNYIVKGVNQKTIIIKRIN